MIKQLKLSDEYIDLIKMLTKGKTSLINGELYINLKSIIEASD